MVDPNESRNRELEAEQPLDAPVPPASPAQQPALEPAAPPEPEPKARWRWQPGQQLEREVGALPTRTEACVELYHSHALDRVAGLLQSFNEGFTHVMFDRTQSETTLSDEYENTVFHIEYRLCEEQRDQLRVSWAAQAPYQRHSDAELLALARQIADQLGGGTNLRLIEVPTE